MSNLSHITAGVTEQGLKIRAAVEARAAELRRAAMVAATATYPRLPAPPLPPLIDPLAGRVFAHPIDRERAAAEARGEMYRSGD